MLIICVKCKETFDGSETRRKCKICVDDFAKKQMPFSSYMSQLSRYFQNPVYQFLRSQHSEELKHPKFYSEEEITKHLIQLLRV